MKRILLLDFKLGCYILKLLGKGYEICYLIKIKLVAGKDEIWFMIFKALSEKSLKVLLGGGVYTKFTDFKHVREKWLNLVHELLKLVIK